MEYSAGNIFSTLPVGMRLELEGVTNKRVDGAARVGEVRLVRGRGSSLLVDGCRIPLYTFVSGTQMHRTLLQLCSGSLYAHLSTLAEGFVSPCDGVRVGVCGRARYDGGRLVAIDDVSSLIYRIATVPSSVGEELFAAFRGAKKGMLIYSPAGGGKTTALRTLVPMLARRGDVGNIAVVDERCEFSSHECSSHGVSHLRGYKRALGAEIALRTLGARVVVIDELGSVGESLSVRSFAECGVRLLATSHAASLDELLHSDTLAPFIEKNIFDVFVGIFNTDGHYRCKVDKI
ncbi:MAG: hypothetical protein IJD51_03890 [Clostridia bacterium]|nr:hypothetical protein [Clostridia bacterium]